MSNAELNVLKLNELVVKDKSGNMVTLSIDPDPNEVSSAIIATDEQFTEGTVTDKVPNVKQVTDQLTALAAKFANLYAYKGTVDNFEALPTENLEVGHVYNLKDTGKNYAWDGAAWDDLGGTVSIKLATDEEYETGTATDIAPSVKQVVDSLAVLAQMITSMNGLFKYKGSVDNFEALPVDGLEVGHTYNLLDTGANYVWDGTAWDKLSENIDLSGVATLATDEEFAAGTSTDTATTVKQVTDAVNMLDTLVVTEVPTEWPTNLKDTGLLLVVSDS